MEALNDILINKCLSDDPLKNKKYEITINNLQSEENRDLIFELTVPKLNNNGNAKDNDPIIQLSVQYTNVVKDKQEILSNVCTINRIDGKQIGERNIELDVQYNSIHWMLYKISLFVMWFCTYFMFKSLKKSIYPTDNIHIQTTSKSHKINHKCKFILDSCSTYVDAPNTEQKRNSMHWKL